MSAIEWTEETWNPTTGCDRVSDGCDHCYALTMARRLKAMGNPKYQRDGDPRTSGPGFGVSTHQDVLTLPLRWTKPQMVFVNSMSDLFHDDIPDEFIARVFVTMARTPQHTYQILTKRHGRMRSLIGDEFSGGHRLMDALTDEADAEALYDAPWPLPNVWLGVSAEDQRWADIRIPALLGTAAAVRWVSAEPLRGPVDLARWLVPEMTACQTDGQPDTMRALAELGRAAARREGWAGLDWVVVGGESGPGARPMHPDWARDLRDQCTAAGVPFFFKQWGAWAPTGKVGLGGTLPGEIRVGDPVDERGFRVEMRRTSKKAAGRELDGREWDEYPGGG